MSRLSSLTMIACGVFLLAGCSDNRIEQTEIKVRRWADRLDAKTTDKGVYQRIEGPELPEHDAWGNVLRVSYTQGGVAEMVKVSSAGPDQIHDSRDDIVEQRLAMNFKGVGEGIRGNAGAVAREVAKGAVEGVAEGVSETVGAAATTAKEAVKKRLPSFKREPADEKAATDAPKEPSE